MFGDPVANPFGFKRVPLVDCCASPDDIRCGPFGTQLLREEFTRSGVPLWGIKHVNQFFTIDTDEFVTPAKARELSNYDLVSGDLVMTRKGTVGNCAIYPEKFPAGIMHSDLLRVRVATDMCNPHFLSQQIRSSRDISRQIELISGGAIMAGINVGKLKKLTVLLPPLELQNAFQDRLGSVSKVTHCQNSDLNAWRRLFHSIQHRAFQGEL